jgi:hypothetical protein
VTALALGLLIVCGLALAALLAMRIPPFDPWLKKPHDWNGDDDAT